MSGRIEGLDETLAAFAKLGLAGEREGSKAVSATAQKVRSDAIKSIQRGTKSGTTYTRGPGQNLSPTHTASAPGQAPATDTGRLVNSIKAVSTGLSGAVFSKLDYSFWLEYGTLNMAPRPFLNPALQDNKKYFLDQLNQGVNRAAADFNKSGEDFL